MPWTYWVEYSGWASALRSVLWDALVALRETLACLALHDSLWVPSRVQMGVFRGTLKPSTRCKSKTLYVYCLWLLCPTSVKLGGGSVLPKSITLYPREEQTFC